MPIGDAAGESNPPPNPSRGRTRSRGNARGRGGSRKGKVANLQAEEGAGGSQSPSQSPKRKASGDEESQSTSRKRTKCDSNVITKKDFLEALKRIDKSKPAGKGSQGLAVYHINGPVQGCMAVVKIIDRDRLDSEAAGKISREVANLRQVKQLLAWGRRNQPKLDYILMRNMGVPLSKTKLDPIKDAEFITEKKTEALKRYEAEYHLKHGDPNGNGNYLWDIKDEENPDMNARYDVNVIDWAEATQIDPATNIFAQPSSRYVVPNDKDIFGPKESPESSKKGSSTPNSNSDNESKKAGTSGTNIYSNAGGGTRSSTRIAGLAKDKGEGTSGTSGKP